MPTSPTPMSPLFPYTTLFRSQLLAGFLTLFLDIRPGRSPARFQKLHESLYFDVVFFFGAARKAWRETHFHFGIKAARESGVATDLDLTAPHFEQVEDPFGECLRRPPRCEWTVIRSARGHAGLVDGNPAGHVAAWISIPQIHLEDRCRPQAHQVAIALGKK